jgi:hypothetical protein
MLHATSLPDPLRLQALLATADQPPSAPIADQFVQVSGNSTQDDASDSWPLPQAHDEDAPAIGWGNQYGVDIPIPGDWGEVIFVPLPESMQPVYLDHLPDWATPAQTLAAGSWGLGGLVAFASAPADWLQLTVNPATWPYGPLSDEAKYPAGARPSKCIIIIIQPLLGAPTK